MATLDILLRYTTTHIINLLNFYHLILFLL